MLKEQEKLFHKMALCVDGILVGISFICAFGIRNNLESTFLNDLPPFSEYLPSMLLVIPLWVIVLTSVGAYKSMRQKGFFLIFLTVFEASLIAVLQFAALAFLLKLDILSRTFIVLFFVVTVVLLSLERWFILTVLRRSRKKGFNFRSMLIIGSGPRARAFAATIESHSDWGYKILGFIDDEEIEGCPDSVSRIIGRFDDLAQILDRNVVDEVVFLMPRKWLDRLEKYIKVCEKVGVKATVSIDLFDTAIAKPVIQELDGWPLLTFDATPNDFFFLLLKRTLDMVGSAAGILILSPLFLFIGIIIKTTSPGPVFFRQVRCSVNGRTFQILKFRTMVVDAENKREELQQQNELQGPVFKIRNDPRITSFGKLLRKTSLDELPQLINVLRGDMSLVGPRPPLPSEVERYERWQRRRLSMRPGITCIHEVVARNNKDFNVWMKMDLEYIDNWSFGLDMRILAKTILAVIRGTGC